MNKIDYISLQYLSYKTACKAMRLIPVPFSVWHRNASDVGFHKPCNFCPCGAMDTPRPFSYRGN